VSEFKEAEVVGKDGRTLTLDYLKGGPGTSSQPGIQMEDEDVEYILEQPDAVEATMDFSRLINPKMVSQAEMVSQAKMVSQPKMVSQAPGPNSTESSNPPVDVQLTTTITIYDDLNRTRIQDTCSGFQD